MNPPGGPVGIANLAGVTSGAFVASDDDIRDQNLFNSWKAAPAAPNSFGGDVNRAPLPIGPARPLVGTRGAVRIGGLWRQRQ